MKKYTVYAHEQLGFEAIKNGFSWPGFCFTWVWAFIKRLWGIGVGILIVSVILGTLFEESFDAGGPWIFAASALALLLGVYIGLYGNDWRERSMPKRGFRFLGEFEAGSPEGAVAFAIRAEKKPSAADTGPDSRVAKETALSAGEAAGVPLPTSSTESQYVADSVHYDQAWSEIERSTPVKATWARAFSEVGGDEAKAKARYIALRVGQLRLASVAQGAVSGHAVPTSSGATSAEAPKHGEPVPAIPMGRVEPPQARVKSLSGSEWDLSELHRSTHAGPKDGTHEQTAGAVDLATRLPDGATRRNRTIAIAAGILVVGLLIAVFSGLRFTDKRAAWKGIEPAASALPEAAPDDAEGQPAQAVPPAVASQHSQQPLEVFESGSLPTSVDSLRASPDADVEDSASSKEQGSPSSAAEIRRAGPNKEQTWERVYTPSAGCVNPIDWDLYVECINARMRARDAFEKKWDRGEYQTR